MIIQIELTDAELKLLNKQASTSNGSMMPMMGMSNVVTDFEGELNNYKTHRLASARELVRRDITSSMTDEELATTI